MQISKTFKIATIAIASLLALSSTAFAAEKGDKGKDASSKSGDQSNKCAAGADPNATDTANCTTDPAATQH